MKKHTIDKEKYPEYHFISYGPLSIKLINNFSFANNIKTLSEAKAITKEKFLSLSGLGIDSWNELQEYIKKYENQVME